MAVPPASYNNIKSATGYFIEGHYHVNGIQGKGSFRNLSHSAKGNEPNTGKIIKFFKGENPVVSLNSHRIEDSNGTKIVQVETTPSSLTDFFHSTLLLYKGKNHDIKEQFLALAESAAENCIHYGDHDPLIMNDELLEYLANNSTKSLTIEYMKMVQSLGSKVNFAAYTAIMKDVLGGTLTEEQAKTQLAALSMAQKLTLIQSNNPANKKLAHTHVDENKAKLVFPIIYHTFFKDLNALIKGGATEQDLLEFRRRLTAVENVPIVGVQTNHVSQTQAPSNSAAPQPKLAKSHIPPVCMHAGIENPTGSACFLITTLQLVAHIPVLREHIENSVKNLKQKPGESKLEFDLRAKVLNGLNNISKLILNGNGNKGKEYKAAPIPRAVLHPLRLDLTDAGIIKEQVSFRRLEPDEPGDTLFTIENLLNYIEFNGSSGVKETSRRLIGRDLTMNDEPVLGNFYKNKTLQEIYSESPKAKLTNNIGIEKEKVLLKSQYVLTNHLTGIQGAPNFERDYKPQVKQETVWAIENDKKKLVQRPYHVETTTVTIPDGTASLLIYNIEVLDKAFYNNKFDAPETIQPFPGGPIYHLAFIHTSNGHHATSMVKDFNEKDPTKQWTLFNDSHVSAIRRDKGKIADLRNYFYTVIE